MRGVLILSILCVLLPLGAVGQNGYVVRVRPQDVLTISVLDQKDLQNVRSTVDLEGAITFPLIGRVPVAGLTVPEAVSELKKRLADGYFKNPQITLNLEQHRAPQVFVFGAVKDPGTKTLAERMTLVEVLARAGYGEASEAIIVRTKGATGPVLPGENSASEVIRVNLREFEKDVEKGELSRNIPLADGDTIYVPRTDSNRVFVVGEVRDQGAYSVPQGTTVLEVLQLAGGVTENASTRRMKIIRLVGGKKRTISAKFDTVVQPGDTIKVPEKWF